VNVNAWTLRHMFDQMFDLTSSLLLTHHGRNFISSQTTMTTGLLQIPHDHGIYQ